MSRYLFSIILIFVFLYKGYGQQRPTFSSFYENGLIWNPALTAKWNRWEVSATHRKEWTGFEDAPEYSTVTFQYPFLKKFTQLALGGFLESDKVGPYENIGFGLTYNYRVQPLLFGNPDDVLGFGLLTRFNQYSFNPTQLTFFDNANPLSTTTVSDIDNGFLPNVSVGVFYISVSDFYRFESHYYFGASVNQLLSGQQVNLGRGGINSEFHFSLHGGFRHFPFRANYYFEPNILINFTPNGQVNAMAGFRYEKEYKYWLSGGIVSNGEIFAQAGVIFDEDSLLRSVLNDGLLRIGVKMDYGLDVLGIGRFAGVGYEIYLAYLFELE
jgi:type IX secretion system PorP/SprF family membrane protein